MFLDVLRSSAKEPSSVASNQKQPAQRVGLMRYSWQRAAVDDPGNSLFGACKDAFASAKTLRDVESQLRRKVAELAGQYKDNLSFDGFVPPEMSRLVIGSPSR